MKKLNVVYMGTPHFAVAPLEAIMAAGHNIKAVVTVPDKPAGRGRKVHTSPVKDFAVAHNIPVLQPEKLRKPDFVAALKEIEPDVMIVVAFRMLPKIVWEIPALGTFNLHASLLPQYRGAAPINWAVINNEKESGVTTFLIDDKIDTGNILLQEKVTLQADETAGSLHDKLMEVGAALVVKTLDGLAHDAIKPTPQSEDNTLKAAPKIFREDCRVNWHQPGPAIEAFIRGLSPYPAAFSAVAGEIYTGEIKWLAVKFETNAEGNEIPTLYIQAKKMWVGLPDGQLHILEIKPQGKRAMNVQDFLNGLSGKTGAIEL